MKFLILIVFLALHNKQFQEIKHHEPIDICEPEETPQFLQKLAWRESRNDWKITNKYGYMGKYQIGKLALKELQLSIDVSEFEKNPEIFPENMQDSCIKELLKRNQKYLKKHIAKYKNKTIHGVLITESGILGAAQLVGQRKVKIWLDSECYRRTTDKNGATAKSYFIMFQNMNLDFLKNN